MADKKAVGDAVTKPDYGEKGQPEPIAPNRTDAEGIDSSTQPGAATGEPARVAEARALVEAFDAQRAPYEDKGGRLPQVLKSALDVNRDGKIYRIPAGSVVKETDLTEEEWDHVIALDIVGEATLADLRAQEAREAAAETDAKMRELKREQIGVKPKRSNGSKQPAGSTLIVDLEQAALAEEQRKAAVQTALAGTRR